MKKAMTLVEVLIVVSILGILAAIALPQFQDHSEQAKEAAARDNLRILRQAIEVYAAQHNGVPPGYFNNDPDSMVHPTVFVNQLIVEGNYLSDMPGNPFNNSKTIKVLSAGEDFSEPTGDFGWVYKPSMKQIRLDWPGSDSSGERFFDY